MLLWKEKDSHKLPVICFFNRKHLRPCLFRLDEQLNAAAVSFLTQEVNIENVYFSLQKVSIILQSQFIIMFNLKHVFENSILLWKIQVPSCRYKCVGFCGR